MRPILERADALPEYRFEGGGRIRRATYKSFDEAELVILFGDGDFKVKFPGAAHVYDVRRQEYLGYSDESAVSTDSGPAIFALLPEAVSRITLNMPSRVARGEEAVFSGSVRAGRNPLNTVVHVSVFNPEGVAADAYEQNVKVKNGQIAGSFTTALNDEPGRWKIVATEVFSGMSYEREFQVF